MHRHTRYTGSQCHFAFSLASPLLAPAVHKGTANILSSAMHGPSAFQTVPLRARFHLELRCTLSSAVVLPSCGLAAGSEWMRRLLYRLTRGCMAHRSRPHRLATSLRSRQPLVKPLGCHHGGCVVTGRCAALGATVYARLWV